MHVYYTTQNTTVTYLLTVVVTYTDSHTYTEDYHIVLVYYSTAISINLTLHVQVYMYI